MSFWKRLLWGKLSTFSVIEDTFKQRWLDGKCLCLWPVEVTEHHLDGLFCVGIGVFWAWFDVHNHSTSHPIHICSGVIYEFGSDVRGCLASAAHVQEQQKERKINASASSIQNIHKFLCHDTMNDRWFADVGVRVISIGPSRSSYLLQPPQSDSMGLRRDLNPHLWLGFAFGCPAGGTCPHYLLRQTSERHADRTPEPPQRAPFNVEKRRRSLKSAYVVSGEGGKEKCPIN